ncbi:MAG: RRXRR domain-containing protein [Coleofasciculus sp. Co-bin14]|nr:RRXRR domain-containing protein [Coleofasciculus sp. Co-bin14]
MRVPVLSPEGQPLMPTKPSRARRWLKSRKAKVVHNDLGIFTIQLVSEPSDTKIQPISVGVDPGKKYTGMGVQSARDTLWMAHLQLPFDTVKGRMEQRRMMRRGRRGRRINRKAPYSQRAHRQARFDNRRFKKVPPSIRANRQLELRVIKELTKIYPLTTAVWEILVARGDKGFSPVMVGQYWAIDQLKKLLPVVTQEGWQTSNLRQLLGLEKQKTKKGDAIPATHAVDGVSLAKRQFVRYRQLKGKQGWWEGLVSITPAPFAVIRRPPISRRQLHLMVPSKGGIRRKYGGTTTRHGLRKGDYVKAEMAGRVVFGWVSGDTERQVSVSSADWKRLGQFSAKKVQLLQRSTGLVVVPITGLSNLPLLKGSV